MSKISAQRVRQVLEEGDLRTLRRMHAHLFPHLPQPKNRRETEVTLHMARTVSDSLNFKLRAYSHRWLSERGYPSQLPDRLKPRAERLYPREVHAVGIALDTSSKLLAPAIPLIRTAMENSVMESYADGVTDPKVIKARFLEAGEREKKALFGNLGRARP